MYRGDLFRIFGATLTAMIAAYLIADNRPYYAMALVFINHHLILKLEPLSLRYLFYRFSHALFFTSLFLSPGFDFLLVLMSMLSVLFLVYSPIVSFRKDFARQLFLRARVITYSLALILAASRMVYFSGIFLIFFVFYGVFCILTDLKKLKKKR